MPTFVFPGLIKVLLESNPLTVALACVFVLVLTVGGAWRFYATRWRSRRAESSQPVPGGMLEKEVEYLVRTLATVMIAVIYCIKNQDFDAAERAVRDWTATRDAKSR